MKDIKTGLPTEEDRKLAKKISKKMRAVAIIRGCGMLELLAASIVDKINAGKAAITFTENHILIGLLYNTVRENGEIAHAYKVYRITIPG